MLGGRSTSHEELPTGTVGRNPADQLRLVVFPQYVQGTLHPRWCRISSINGST